MRPTPPETRLVAIVGGSASGKTRLAHAIADAAPDGYVIKEDDYYLDAASLANFDPATFNFDEPAAKDHGLLMSHLAALKAGQAVDIPQYDFTTHSRAPQTRHCRPASLIVVEGLHAVASEALASVFDLIVYVSATRPVRFERRLQRDVAERGRTPESVKHQFDTIVEPMHTLHVEPQKPLADLIVTNMGPPDFDCLAEPVLQRLRLHSHTG
ncbi:uridine kinase [Maricaulis maris]|jgi:uridine kinase|uniref:uridine/cytidine kinase n=1 Tax=Maricaulis maris (strain MCS10) TaxID=394221 RepID=Q0ATP7_MARMM|nr:uridine kinase [Maricaulis maris]ABI64340.1 uridine kinase [Maricaulis maris MCS10]